MLHLFMFVSNQQEVDTSTHDKKSPAPGYSAALSILIALWLIASSGYFPELWGMSYLTFLPDWLKYSAAAVVLFLAIPLVAKKIIGLLEQFSKWLNEVPKRQIVVLSASGIVFVMLASAFSQSIPLLGDGSLRANEIFDGTMWQPTEMLDFFTHALLYEHVFAPMGFAVTTCYRVVSVICGPFFLINAWLLSKHIGGTKSVSVFLLLSTSGIVVLFFGYVESYSIVAAYIPLLVLLQIKAAERKLYWAWPVLAYLLGGLIHSVVLLLFAAPTLYILLSRRAVELKDIKSVHRVIAVIVIVGTIAGFVLSSIKGILFSDYLLPFLKDSSVSQAQLTSHHALNIINWLFFASLPFLLFLPGLLSKKRFTENQVASPAAGLMFWLCISALLLIFFFRPQIGGPRDWDLFSLAAFCLIPAAIVIHRLKWKGYFPHQIIPTLFLSGILVASFVAINNSPRKSVERFVEIIETAKFGNLYLEYATLFSYSSTYPELSDLRKDFGRRAWEQPARTLQDSLFITQSMAMQHLAEGDEKEASRWIGRALQTDSTNLSTYKILIQYLEQTGDKQRLVNLAGLLESLFSVDADGLMQAGLIYMKQNRLEEAEQPLRRAFKLDEYNFSIVMNLGNYFSLNDQFDSAAVMYKRATVIDASSFTAVFGLASAQYFSGNQESARRTLDIAERYARTKEEREKVSYMRRYLGQ